MQIIREIDSRLKKHQRFIEYFLLILLSLFIVSLLVLIYLWGISYNTLYDDYTHWTNVKDKPHFVTQDADTIDFGDNAAVKRNKCDSTACIHTIQLEPNMEFTYAVSDHFIRKNVIAGIYDLHKEVKRRDFCNAIYIFCSLNDTIYVHIELLGANALLGYVYNCEFNIPGSRYMVWFFGSGYNVEKMCEYIRKVVYKNDAREILFNAELTENFCK